MLTNINSKTTYESTLKIPDINKQRLTHQQPSKTNKLIPFTIGLVLVALLITQYFYPVNITKLIALQNNNIYKQISGFIILFFVLMQWRLTHLRNTNQSKKIRSAYNSHQWLGISAPILIFMHTMQTGYAYQSILLFSFIGLIIIGLCNYQIFQSRKKWYINTWLTLHISLATVCLTMMIYHIYIAYTYS